MKKIIIFILLILSMTLTSCSGIHKEEILIGFASSLDYSFGNTGVDSMYGAKLAVKEINDAGGIDGKNLRLIVKSDDRDPIKSVEIDNELKELGAIAIIGHSYSLLASSIISNSTENDILLISPTISTDIVTGLDDLFIRMTPVTRDQGYSLANAMHEYSPGDVIVIYEGTNLAFSGDILAAFKEKYEQLGHQVSEDNIYNLTTSELSDYASLSNEINNSIIPNVLIIGSAFDAANIVQKINQPENYHFYFPSWTGTSELLDLAGPKINNSIMMNYFDVNSNNLRFTEFAETYIEEFGMDYSYASLLGYESVYLLADALENTTDWSSQNLKSYIVSQPTFIGLLDNIRMSEFGEVSRKIYHTRIVDGEYITLGSDTYA